MNEPCYVSGFPRSGTHRIQQVIWCLVHKRPFDYPNGYDWLRDNNYIRVHWNGNELSGKAIYTHRNREDVIDSMVWFFPDWIHTRKDAEDIVNNGTWWNDFQREKWGSWQAHIESYMNRPNTLVLKYEDFSDEQVRQIAEFLGLEHNPDIVSWVSQETAMAAEDAYFSTHPETRAAHKHINRKTKKEFHIKGKPGRSK